MDIAAGKTPGIKCVKLMNDYVQDHSMSTVLASQPTISDFPQTS